jgi:hypothetical protein
MTPRTKKLLIYGGVAAGALLVGRKLFKGSLAGLGLGFGEDAPADTTTTPGAVAPSQPSSLPATAVTSSPAGVTPSSLPASSVATQARKPGLLGKAKWVLPAAIGAGVLYFMMKRRKK